MTMLFYEMWPVRIVKVLRAEHVQTWADLQALPVARLLQHKNFGAKALAFVQARLTEQGLGFDYPQWARTPMPMLIDVPALDGVYFLRCGDFVKIGQAKDIRARLAGIQVGIPYDVTLLHHIPCASRVLAVQTEAELHDRFAALRHRGEWFRLEGHLHEFIAALRVAA